MTDQPDTAAADPFNALQSRRDKARAEPPRVKIENGNVMPKPASTASDGQGQPFDLRAPEKKTKKPSKRAALDLSEAEFYLMRHLAHQAGVSPRIIVETALRFYAEHHKPELIAKIEEALADGS